MGTIKEGARQAVRNCLKIKPEEKVVIITDRKTIEIARVIEKETRLVTDAIDFFVMEDFGKRPLMNFPSQISKALKKADASFYIARGGFGDERFAFRKPMLDIVDAENVRHAHMINITQEIMKRGVCSDYAKVRKISREVYEKVKDAKQIRVTSDKGTDMVAEFSSCLRWNICDGTIEPGNWRNLPGGEVFTSPYNVNGKVIIDGCLGDYLRKYGTLEKIPITIKIKDSRAKTVHCDNKKLEKELKTYLFDIDSNSNRIGEFAIGTNVDIKKLIGNMLQDEKFPGVHIAFGSPFPSETGASWDSKAHLDALIKNPTVFVDGNMIMDTGKFLLQY